MTPPFSFYSTKKFKVLHSFNSGNASRRRHGVSPVIATTIILAITITLGLSLWSFANSGVATAMDRYANVVTEFGEYASDKFVIVNMAFDHPSIDHVTVWVYNSGQLSTEVDSIMLSCKHPEECRTSFDPVTADRTDLNGTNPIASKSLEALSFDAGMMPDSYTYELRVLSSTGAYQTQYQVK